jgi:hypothetical protein
MWIRDMGVTHIRDCNVFSGIWGIISNKYHIAEWNIACLSMKKIKVDLEFLLSWKNVFSLNGFMYGHNLLERSKSRHIIPTVFIPLTGCVDERSICQYPWYQDKTTQPWFRPRWGIRSGLGPTLQPAACSTKWRPWVCHLQSSKGMSDPDRSLGPGSPCGRCPTPEAH